MWNTSISCISFQFSRFPWQFLSCLDINRISSRNSHLWWNSCQSVQKLKFYFENRFCCILFGFTLPSLQYTTIDLAWISKEELAITALMVCIRVVFYVCFFIQSASREGVRVVQGSKILNFRGMSFMYDPIMEIQNYEDFRNFEETFDWASVPSFQLPIASSVDLMFQKMIRTNGSMEGLISVLWGN